MSLINLKMISCQNFLLILISLLSVPGARLFLRTNARPYPSPNFSFFCAFLRKAELKITKLLHDFDKLKNDLLPNFFIDFDFPPICSRCSFVFEDKCKTISIPKCTIDWEKRCTSTPDCTTIEAKSCTEVEKDVCVTHMDKTCTMSTLNVCRKVSVMF